MSIKRRLGSLTSAGPGTQRAATDEPPPSHGSNAGPISELRSRIHAMMARPRRSPVPSPAERRRQLAETLPFVVHETVHGGHHHRVRIYDAAARHGNVSLHAALDASGSAIATLALDDSLRSVDWTRALFLDTETTGLAGGTGTIPFLIGIASFRGHEFHAEQSFLADLCDERAMLEWLAERISQASALVTFNGKAFDMPLIRTRFVLSRVKAPAEPPHLDLLHVARRVYRARVEACRLTTLERDVLGFVREADVPSGEIPERYTNYLRSGDAEPLSAVVDHNLWDIIAMAALMGELAARAVGETAGGRFEGSDMTGMARTALRAGESGLATTLADAAASASLARGEMNVLATAHTLAAEVLRRTDRHDERLRRLLEAAAATPDDATIQLSISKHYEHKLGDPLRALEHAQRSAGAELDDVLARRLKRLTARIDKKPVSPARSRRRRKP